MASLLRKREGACEACGTAFSLLKLKHECRRCGAAVCGSCSSQCTKLMRLSRKRVCDDCFARSQPSLRSEVPDINGGSGRVLSLDPTSGLFDLSSWLETEEVEEEEEDWAEPSPRAVLDERQQRQAAALARARCPPLRIVILIVGSRGDVQPFIPWAQALEACGHSVRIAAHECFREFVGRYGLEFFPIAGDPKELMEFMVEQSLLSVKFMTEGIQAHRRWVKALLRTCMDACTTTLKAEGDNDYRADVVVANPPSFAGPHVAEALGVPLVMSFTMPWSPTTAFPAPFVHQLPSSSGRLNYHSFGAVDRMIWTGIKDMVNTWRTQELGLPALHSLNFSGHRLLTRRKVPFIYCYSSHLLPKPADWGNHLHVVGFYFLDAAQKRDASKDHTSVEQTGDEQTSDKQTGDEQEKDEEAERETQETQETQETEQAKKEQHTEEEVQEEEEEKQEEEKQEEEVEKEETKKKNAGEEWAPDARLQAFLDAGEAPVFVGFGSIVVAEPSRLTSLVMEGLRLSGVRALVQQGWAGLGDAEVPANVLVLGAAPHDLLFPLCAAVVHHGGAGTTSTGLRAGRPTLVVPFFGDQFFWGRTVAEMGVGPAPLPYASLTAEAFAAAVAEATAPATRRRAAALGARIAAERGVERGVEAFHLALDVAQLACPTCPAAAPSLVALHCPACELRLCRACDGAVHGQASLRRHARAPAALHRWQAQANAVQAAAAKVKQAVGAAAAAAAAAAPLAARESPTATAAAAAAARDSPSLGAKESPQGPDGERRPTPSPAPDPRQAPPPLAAAAAAAVCERHARLLAERRSSSASSLSSLSEHSSSASSLSAAP